MPTTDGEYDSSQGKLGGHEAQSSDSSASSDQGAAPADSGMNSAPPSNDDRQAAGDSGMADSDANSSPQETSDAGSGDETNAGAGKRLRLADGQRCAAGRSGGFDGFRLAGVRSGHPKFRTGAIRSGCGAAEFRHTARRSGSRLWRSPARLGRARRGTGVSAQQQRRPVAPGGGGQQPRPGRRWRRNRRLHRARIVRPRLRPVALRRPARQATANRPVPIPVPIPGRVPRSCRRHWWKMVTPPMALTRLPAIARAHRAPSCPSRPAETARSERHSACGCPRRFERGHAIADFCRSRRRWAARKRAGLPRAEWRFGFAGQRIGGKRRRFPANRRRRLPCGARHSPRRGAERRKRRPAVADLAGRRRRIDAVARWRHR